MQLEVVSDDREFSHAARQPRFQPPSPSMSRTVYPQALTTVVPQGICRSRLKEGS
jgi:hypothetical protein